MAEENRWGTVFMGPTSDRESRLDKISNREEQDLWNRRTEAEYMRRVKERAVEQLNAMLAETQEQAAGLLAAAQADADNIRQAAEALRDEARQDREAAAAELENARDIRAKSYDEGYDRGVEQAMLELEEQRAAIDATTLAVLKAMEDQCGTLFASWRDELTALLRQCVETGLGWVLDEERAAILENLLCKALDTLENQRRITVRANPADAPAVEEVLNSVRARFSDLKTWEVKSDETLTPGGLVVESVSGRVESRAETRREIVEQTLRHLTLPESEADAAAMEAVLAVADKAGVPALEQAVLDAEQRALERQQAVPAAEDSSEIPSDSEAPKIAHEPSAEAPTAPHPAESGPAEPAPAASAPHETKPVAAAEPIPHADPTPQAESAPETPPRPKRPTPKNPAVAALPEGAAPHPTAPDLSATQFSDAQLADAQLADALPPESHPDLSPDEDAEFDRMAKEIARSMMFGETEPSGSLSDPAAPSTDDAFTDADEAPASPDTEPEEDNGGFVGAPDFTMPDFDNMTIEEAEAMARKLLEAQN